MSAARFDRRTSTLDRIPAYQPKQALVPATACIADGVLAIPPLHIDMATPQKKTPSRYSPSSQHFTKEEFPFYWLARLMSVYTMQMEKALKKVDADVPTYRVLFILKEHGKSSITEISVHAIAKLSTITKIVYRMKADGLVDTGTSEQDGRMTEVGLTEAGVQAIERIQGATDRIFQASFKGLTDAQIQRLNRMLEVVFNNLADH